MPPGLPRQQPVRSAPAAVEMQRPTEQADLRSSVGASLRPAKGSCTRAQADDPKRPPMTDPFISNGHVFQPLHRARVARQRPSAHRPSLHFAPLTPERSGPPPVPHLDPLQPPPPASPTARHPPRDPRLARAHRARPRPPRPRRGRHPRARHHVPRGARGERDLGAGADEARDGRHQVRSLLFLPSFPLAQAESRAGRSPSSVAGVLAQLIQGSTSVPDAGRSPPLVVDGLCGVPPAVVLADVSLHAISLSTFGC